jgi:WD40 repeat protein
MGFVPRIDVREAGNISGHRTEILAWSTGATVCLRERERKNGYGSGKDNFSVWKPTGAKEGRDDITALHLLPNGRSQAEGTESHTMVIGTANGDLQQVEIPRADAISGKINVISLSTAKLPVRGSSVYHGADGVTSLIVGLGDSQISLYNLEPTLDNTSIEPLSQIDISKDSSSIVSAMSSMKISTSKRIWHTSFLSATMLAVGLGPSQAPIEIYTIQGNGILQSPLRTFQIFRTDDEARIDLPSQGTAASKPFLSSVYTIVPLPGSSASSADLGGNSNGDVFLSGAYDGLIRLHDLRSNRDHVQMYSDAAGGGGNDSPIYSLLTRGIERVLAGTGRHNLLKVFDLRMGARCYDYLDAQTHHQPGESSFGAANKTFGSSGSESFNLFLRENSGGIAGVSSPSIQNVQRGSRRPAPNRRPAVDSSIYTLVASDACSPYIYAGVENQIISLALHAVADIHPDTAYFEAPRASDEDLWWRGAVDGLGGGLNQQQPQQQESEIMNLSMYEQDLGMKLCVQRPIGDARRVQAVALANPGVFGEVALGSSSNRGVRKDGWLAGRTVFGGLDERWMDAADADGGRWQRGLAQ